MTASQTPQQLTISSCIFFLAMFWFTPVAAESFFTGYVKVKDQERSTYKKASASAFLQVLNKSTGKNNKELLSHHSIQASAENAYKLVQQFSYEKDIAALTDTTYLVATFNQKNIRQVLQDANLKMLLAHRPSIAVIAVTQYKGTLRVLRPNRPVLDADYGDL
ncbi:MAG: DUF2066 domain-containing protein, partial [Sinobacterium sp.]|nr:DUF2066 domain-containing protein [Sinobacterium sp.]